MNEVYKSRLFNKYDSLLKSSIIDTISNFEKDKVYFEDRYIESCKELEGYDSEKFPNMMFDNCCDKEYYRSRITTLLDNCPYNMKKLIKTIEYKECFEYIQGFLKEIIIKREFMLNHDERLKKSSNKYKNLEISVFLDFLPILKEFRNSISHGQTYSSCYVNRYDFNAKLKVGEIFLKSGFITKKDFYVCKNTCQYYNNKYSY